jgi:hypothetical protein
MYIIIKVSRQLIIRHMIMPLVRVNNVEIIPVNSKPMPSSTFSMLLEKYWII